jgi:hypothetical protein
MSRNGSGTFTTLSTFATAGQAPTASDHNAIINDIADGLTDSINKDGTKAFAAAQSMGGFKLTSLGTATARTEAANLGQVQDAKTNWVDGAGTADAITATYGPVITTLVDGQECCVRATLANATTTPTFAPNGLTARTIVKHGGAALVAGDIAGDGHELVLRYDLTNTRWELLNPKVPGAITGTANTFTAAQTIAIDDAVTNTVTDILKLAHTSSGTAAADFGAGLLYQLEDAAGTLTDAASIDTAWVDATDATEDSKISFKTMIGGVAKAEAGYIAQGLVLGAPTGGDKGAGKINTTGLFINGAAVGITIGTAQATTSGTSIDFTSIPAGTKRITVMLAGVSTSGTSPILIQLGDAGGVENTGYVSQVALTGSAGSFGSSTAGYVLTQADEQVAGNTFIGAITLNHFGNNIWIAEGNIGTTTNSLVLGATGSKTLSAELDRIRLTTAGGADTFDAGSMNISYE